MAKTAGIIWFLDWFGTVTRTRDPQTIHALAGQIRKTSAMLMARIAKQGFELNRDMMFAQTHLRKMHWMVSEALGGYHIIKDSESAFMAMLRDSKLDALPDLLILVCPGAKGINWANFLAERTQKDVWVVAKEGQQLQGLSEYIEKIKMPESKKPAGPSRTQAIVLMDLENLVTIHKSVEEPAYKETERFLKLFAEYLERHGMAINSKFSIACLRRNYRGERDLARLMAPYGIQIVCALDAQEPAECRIVHQANMISRRVAKDRNGLVPKQAIVLSGDGHVLPAVKSLAKCGISVLLLSWGDKTNRNLSREAHTFVRLGNMLGATGVAEGGYNRIGMPEKQAVHS